MITFKEYQDGIPITILPQVKALGWLYPLLGIGGESGETIEKFKKIVRDKLAHQLMEHPGWTAQDFLKGITIPAEDKKTISKELGDQLFYIAWMCIILGLDLSTVAQENQNKLLDRKNRGVLGGSGDNR